MFELTLQPPQSPKIGFEDDRQSVPETSTLTVEDDRLSYMSLARKVSEYQDSKPFFSIEFFPPRSEKGATSLVKLLESYREGDAHFLDITWHVAGNPGRETPTSSITIAGVALNYCCFDTMLHIICIGLTKQDLKRHLERAKTLGIRNLLALRGDKHANYETSDFHFASDLVSFIRAEYGQYFTIVVAGYPIPHPESPTPEDDLHWLKRKVDAGADFIITQLFFNAQDFIDFVANCRRIGIQVPIIPGICAINSYESLVKFSSLSSVTIPEKVLRDLEPIKSNVEAVRNYGVHYLVHLCRQLIEANVAPGLHFFTLNQSTVIRVLKELGLWKKQTIQYLPWRRSFNYSRRLESTRPIFWSNRPKSYIHRTQHWTEYPFAFWSINFSHKLKNLDNFYEFLHSSTDRKELDQFFAQTKIESISQIFDNFYCPKPKVSVLPWIQQPNPPFLETMYAKYGCFISKGVLIINYQPSLNGGKSEEGWGEPNGYIYQKEYLEFFLNNQHLPRLLASLAEAKCVSYAISNRDESVLHSNWPKQIPITLSWGLFPSYQLIPVFVADLKAFTVWRQEAFELLEGWSGHYECDSCQYRLISNVASRYCLVSLIDNQFVQKSSTFETILRNLTD